MKEILIIAFMLTALAIIFLVLIQQGKGAGMGASFGAGASATLFGSSGAGSFLTRLTSILAAVFFGLCLLLANIDSRALTQKDSEKWLIGESEQAASTSDHNQIEIPKPIAPADTVPTEKDKGGAETIPQ